MKMGDECSKCGSEEELQEHHTSYEPEITIILCRDCHQEEHPNHGVGRGKQLGFETTTIAVSQEFKSWLDREGTRGESYEDILKRMTDFSEKSRGENE